MPSFRLSIAFAAVVLLAACAAPSTSIHQSVGKDPDKPLPHKVLLVEPDILVHEISTGGVVEKVDDWSKEASGHAVTAIEGVVQSQHLFELVRSPHLSAADKALLEQYTALYALVGASAYGAGHSPYTAWRERAAQFDYTLGPGLTPFSEHAHVDAAVFLVGTDYISSAGRKAAMAFGVLASILSGVVMVPTSMPAFMSVGVVDMRSGDLIWFSSDIRSGSANLRDPAVMKSLVEGLFATYPGAVKATNASK
jgi:hypothetical protein